MTAHAVLRKVMNAADVAGIENAGAQGKVREQGGESVHGLILIRMVVAGILFVSYLPISYGLSINKDKALGQS